MPPSETPPPLVLGIDIGGTASRAVLADAADDGPVLRSASAASASLVAAGREQADAVVTELLAALGLDEPEESGATSLAAICIGSAGTGTATSEEWLIGRVAPLVPSPAARHVSVVNDAYLALAAAGLDSGIAVISGTGSIAVGALGQRRTKAGGWGYIVGDEGSGYSIARMAVRELCRRNDGGLPLGPLGGAILGAVGVATVPDVVHEFHEHPAPARWAALAPDILDCGDPASGVIQDAAATALARWAAEVAGRLEHPSPLPVVLAGGLLVNHVGLREATIAALETGLGAAAATTATAATATHAADAHRPATIDVRTATEPPVTGAVRLARQLAHELAKAGTME